MDQNENEIEDSDEDRAIEEEDMSFEDGAMAMAHTKEATSSRGVQQVTIKDVVEDKILQFLPAKSALRFRCVSKDWDKLIRSSIFSICQSSCFRKLSGYFCQQYESIDETFTFLSLNRSAYGVSRPFLTFIPGFVNIISSSGGLLLCQGRENNQYYICNPVTEKWKRIPNSESCHGLGSSTILAFEPSLLNLEAHYQLICVVPMIGNPTIVGFEMYSSETGLWKQCATVCVELVDSSFVGNGFFFNGIAFWETTYREILAFDCVNESYEIISLPYNSPQGGVLAEMNGELCYITINGTERLIKIYGGLNFTLKNEIYLEFLNQHPHCTHRILPSIDDGEVMIRVGNMIYAYRLRDRRIELMSQEGIGSFSSKERYIPYVNTLVCIA